VEKDVAVVHKAGILSELVIRDVEICPCLLVRLCIVGFCPSDAIL
jgi:hypothetical protein